MILIYIIIFIFLEIYSLVQLADLIGFFPSLMQVFLSGIFGLILLKTNWAFFLKNISQSVYQQKSISDPVINVFCFFISGVFLMIPGLISDFLALILLIPLTRSFLFYLLKNLFLKHSVNKSFFRNFPERKNTSHGMKDVTPKK